MSYKERSFFFSPLASVTKQTEQTDCSSVLGKNDPLYFFSFLLSFLINICRQTDIKLLWFLHHRHKKIQGKRKIMRNCGHQKQYSRVDSSPGRSSLITSFSLYSFFFILPSLRFSCSLSFIFIFIRLFHLISLSLSFQRLSAQRHFAGDLVSEIERNQSK